MLDPETKRCLEMLQIKVGECLQKDSFTPQDFHEILVGGLTPLARLGGPFVIKLLKWLGKFCEMLEVQEEAGKKSAWGAWGLRQFAKIVRGL